MGGSDCLYQRRVVTLVVAVVGQSIGLSDLVFPCEFVVPTLDTSECLCVVVGSRPVVERDLVRSGTAGIDIGVLDQACLEVCFRLLSRWLQFLDPCLGLFVQAKRGRQCALAHRLVGKPRKSNDLRVGALQGLAFCQQLLQTLRLGAQHLVQLRRVRGRVVAQRLEHAVERVHRHAAVRSDRLDLPAVGVGQRGDGQQKLATLCQYFAFLALRSSYGLAEVEQPPEAFVDPRPLPSRGLQVDLLGNHAHDRAELIAADGGEMLEHCRRIRTVLSR